jgi:hypothetical protein
MNFMFFAQSAAGGAISLPDVLLVSGILVAVLFVVGFLQIGMAAMMVAMFTHRNVTVKGKADLKGKIEGHVSTSEAAPPPRKGNAEAGD